MFDSSDQSSNNTSAARAPAASRPVDLQAHLARLDGISMTTMRRIQELRQNTDTRTNIASEVARCFRGARTGVSRRGRPSNEFRVRITCLRDPDTRSNRRLNHQQLREMSLGIPAHEGEGGGNRGYSRLQLDWDASQVEDYLQTIFPALRSTTFHFCNALNDGGLRPIDPTIRSAAGLQNYFMAVRSGGNLPTLYIRPDQLIEHSPLGTPTVLGRVGGPQQRTEQRSMAEESIEIRRNLIAQQNQAYEESLRTDRERDRQRRLEQEALTRGESERQERDIRLQEMRIERKRRLPEEPSEGLSLRFRLPDGTNGIRRFTEDSDIQTVMDYVGSLPSASERFLIRLPGNTSVVSDRTDMTLEQLGITRSASVNVEWMEETSQMTSHPSQDITTTSLPPTPRRAAAAMAANFIAAVQNDETSQMTSHPSQDITTTSLPPTPRRAAAAMAADFIAAVQNDEVSDVSSPSPHELSSRESDEEETSVIEISNSGTELNLHLSVDEESEESEEAQMEHLDASHGVVEQETGALFVQSAGLEVAEELETGGHSVSGSATRPDRLKVKVRRHFVIEDMVKAFKEDVTERYICIEMDNEKAEDYEGVLRDCLTEFWGAVFSRYFDGQTEAAPVVTCDLGRDAWVAIGRILATGFRQVGYFPLRFCQASLVYALFGEEHTSSEILLNSFMRCLGKVEGSIVQEALDSSDFPDNLVEDLSEILGRYGVRSILNPENCRPLLRRCSEVVCIERALFPLQAMNLRTLMRFPEFRSAGDIKALYDRLQPNARRVANSIRAEVTHPIQQTALDYLRRSVRSFNSDLLQRFLRFVGGSDIMNFSNIEVQFVDLYGLERRFIARTCTHTIEVPTTYFSFNEFAVN